MAAWSRTQHPIRAIRGVQPSPLDAGQWPATIPAVSQLLRDGLELVPATVLVGDNGSGKSTIIEALAMAYGINPEGGSAGAQHQTRPSESPLYEALVLQKSAAAHRGYFLRAETMHGLYTYLEQNQPLGRSDVRFHDLSHGESFNAVLGSRFNGSGLFLLDEPESALSFTGCLALLVTLTDLLRSPAAQVIVATHSPVIAALPGARIYELDENGFTERRWEDLQLVHHHRRFLASPDQYLRHLREGTVDSGED